MCFRYLWRGFHVGPRACIAVKVKPCGSGRAARPDIIGQPGKGQGIGVMAGDLPGIA